MKTLTTMIAACLFAAASSASQPKPWYDSEGEYAINPSLALNQVELSPDKLFNPDDLDHEVTLRPPDSANWVLVQVFWRGKFVGWSWMEAAVVNWLHGVGPNPYGDWL